MGRGRRRGAGPALRRRHPRPRPGVRRSGPRRRPRRQWRDPGRRPGRGRRAGQRRSALPHPRHRPRRGRRPLPRLPVHLPGRADVQARRGAGAGAPRRARAHRTRLARTAGADRRRAGDSRPGAGRPLALQVEAPATRSRWATHRSRGDLRLRPLVRSARGSWVKAGVSWEEIPRLVRAGTVDPAQGAALHQLLLGYRAASASYYYGSEAHLTLALCGAGVWRTLRDAVAAGVELVPAGAVRAVELVTDPVPVLAQATRGDSGAVIRLGVEHAGEWYDGDSVEGIGEPAHGVALWSAVPEGWEVVLAPVTGPARPAGAPAARGAPGPGAPRGGRRPGRRGAAAHRAPRHRRLAGRVGAAARGPRAPAVPRGGLAGSRRRRGVLAVPLRPRPRERRPGLPHRRPVRAARAASRRGGACPARRAPAHRRAGLPALRRRGASGGGGAAGAPDLRGSARRGLPRRGAGALRARRGRRDPPQRAPPRLPRGDRGAGHPLRPARRTGGR